MSKYNFRPDSVHLIPSIPLLLVIAGISFFCTKTLQVSHGFVDRIACSCMAILVSNLWYVALTGMQFVNFRLQTLCTNTSRRGKIELDQKKRSAVVDDRQIFENADDVSLVSGQFNPRTLLCGTIEFRHAPREIRLFLSRKEIWYMMYPTSFAIFVLFYCIPIYDVSCSVALIMGLLAKSIYDEVQRGIYWKRTTGRKICFAFATICGFICASGLLVLSSIVTRQPLVEAKPVMESASVIIMTNASTTPIPLQSTTSPILPDSTSENMIGSLLHGDGYKDAFRRRVEANVTSNATSMIMATPPPPARAEPSTDLPPSDPTDIHTNVVIALNTAYTASMQTPNLTQMIFVWVMCALVPFFLGNTPDSIRLPVLLETTQPAVSCIAALVLFSACATSTRGWLPGDLLDNSAFIAYICISPLGVWCAIYFIFKASRSKTTGHVCCTMMVVAYLKLLHVTSLHQKHSHALQQVSIFVGCVCSLYALLLIIFTRMENKSIQMGWDGSQVEEGDEDDDYMSSDGTGIQDSSHISPRYCIEDVLQRVTQDIKNTEYILSHPQASRSQTTRPNSASSNTVDNASLSTVAESGAVQEDADMPVLTGKNSLSVIAEGLQEDDNDITDEEIENTMLLSPREAGKKHAVRSGSKFTQDDSVV